ncbi:MAG: SusD/RagB family nutrient-binding outer membrane lipoprotein, partial [Bacteroidales bacterium]|nr:SusD/RagB family nutrient-binding outer membrane lipoprotein [Bacteroidales bacterium]
WTGANNGVENYYKEGIRASMDYYNIERLEAERYIAGISNNSFTSGDKEAVLEQIMNQKWLANFPNGSEGWADFRRTDYPALSQIVSNRSNDVEQGKFIKRINYPVSEHDLNSDNVYYPYASDSKGQKLWWDVMDTHNGPYSRNTPNNFR